MEGQSSGGGKMNSQWAPGWYRQPDGSQAYWDGARWVAPQNFGPAPSPTAGMPPPTGSPFGANPAPMDQWPLWSEANGYVLSMEGWQPISVVEAKRSQAVRLQSIGTALVVGGGLVALTVLFFGSGIGLGADTLTLIYTIILVAYVLGGVLIATSWAAGRKVRARISDAGALWRLGVTGVAIIGTLIVLSGTAIAPISEYSADTGSAPAVAEVSAGPLKTDEYGTSSTAVRITSPKDAPSTCTYVASVTASSPDGTRQYSTAIASAQALMPGQTAITEAVFFDQVPANAVIAVEPPGCIPG